jgi:type II secretory ATPase GspE/PulE/Tfp pilus assembly ATPase PilB-like protein
LTDRLRDLITQRTDASTLRRAADETGELQPLRIAAWEMARLGVTTPAEAMRVVRG